MTTLIISNIEYVNSIAEIVIFIITVAAFNIDFVDSNIKAIYFVIKAVYCNIEFVNYVMKAAHSETESTYYYTQTICSCLSWLSRSGLGTPAENRAHVVTVR